MTIITEAALLERMKEIAEVEKPFLENDSFKPRFLWYDDPDRAPRLIMLPHIDGNTHNQVAWAIRLLCSAQENLSELVFIMDAWRCKTLRKKNGEEWGRGGMEYAVVNQTEDAENVEESLCLNIAYNDGNFATANVPYTRTESGIEYNWDPDQLAIHITNVTDGRPGGFFPEAMMTAMVGIKMADAMTEVLGLGASEDFGLEKWQADIHMLAVAVKMVLHQTQFPCWVLGRSEEEAEVIEHSLRDGPFSEGLRAFSIDEIEEIDALEEAYASSDPDS